MTHNPPSSPLDSRKDRHEKRFGHDEQLRFRIETRACKLFGVWIAEQCSMNDAQKDQYALNMVERNMEGPDFIPVLSKARADIDAQDIDLSDHMLEAYLAKCIKEAKDQVMNEVVEPDNSI